MIGLIITFFVDGVISMSERVFVMFPVRIWNLPGITLQLLKFYEKIFQFWHQRSECFVSNATLKEYSGMSSDSSISDAFKFFEKHGELKRVQKNGRRYIVAPAMAVEDKTVVPVDNSDKNGTNNSQGLATAREGSRCSEGGGLAAARHNNINNNNINISKSFCPSDSEKQEPKPTPLKNQSVENRKTENEKKPDWAKPKASPLADVTTQSTSWKPDDRPFKKASEETVKSAISLLPKFLQPKRLQENTHANVDAT